MAIEKPTRAPACVPLHAHHFFLYSRKGRNTMKTKYLAVLHPSGSLAFLDLVYKGMLPFIPFTGLPYSVRTQGLGRGDTALCLEKAYIVVLGNLEYELWV